MIAPLGKSSEATGRSTIVYTTTVYTTIVYTTIVYTTIGYTTIGYTTIVYYYCVYYYWVYYYCVVKLCRHATYYLLLASHFRELLVTSTSLAESQHQLLCAAQAVAKRSIDNE